MEEKIILELSEDDFKKLVVGWSTLASKAKSEGSCLCAKCCTVTKLITDKLKELIDKNEKETIH